MNRKVSSFLTRHVLLAILFIWSLFWILAPFFPIEAVQITMVSLTFATATGVMISWWPPIWGMIQHRGKLEEGHILALGIITMSLALDIRNLWGWAYIYAGKPQWMVDSLFISFTTYMIFVSLCFKLAAKNAKDAVIPRYNFKVIGMWTAFGLALAAILFGFLRYHQMFL